MSGRKMHTGEEQGNQKNRGEHSQEELAYILLRHLA